MRDIPVTQLRAFVTVAKLGSFTKAAELLGYSEPAIHLQVSALRRSVGDPLLERRDGKMKLTRLGEALLPHADRAVRAVETFTLQVARQRSSPSHSLTIGVGRSTGSYVFPAIAALFAERHPEIQLSPQLLPARDIAVGLVKGELDVGMAGGLREHIQALRGGRQIVTITYAKDEWAFLAAPCLRERLANIQDIGSVPCPIFLPEYAKPLLPQLVEAFHAGSHRSRLHFVANAEIAKAAALTGTGIACIPRHAGVLEAAVGDLVECLIDVPLPLTPVAVAHRRPVPNPAVGTFVTFLRNLRHDTRMKRLPLPAELSGLLHRSTASSVASV